MEKYKIGLLLVVLVGIMSCTSLSEGSTSNEIVTEPQDRVLVDGDGTQTLRGRMDEQASEINRKRNIEEFDQNKPAMTPPTLRPQLAENAPLDSTVQSTGNWLNPGLFRNRVIMIR